MPFIGRYLIGYVHLMAGAGLTLWQVGVLFRVSPAWVISSAVFPATFSAVLSGPGLLLAATARDRAITGE
jgi:hypothetical protein